MIRRQDGHVLFFANYCCVGQRSSGGLRPLAVRPAPVTPPRLSRASDVQKEKPLLFTCVRRATLPETLGEMWKKKEKEEEKEEDGKLILMLSNRLGVDVFEIPLQKKKRVGAVQREKFLSRETHLAAGWPSVACAGPQRRRARQMATPLPGWACLSGLVVGGVIGGAGVAPALRLGRHPL